MAWSNHPRSVEVAPGRQAATCRIEELEAEIEPMTTAADPIALKCIGSAAGPTEPALMHIEVDDGLVAAGQLVRVSGAVQVRGRVV